MVEVDMNHGTVYLYKGKSFVVAPKVSYPDNMVWSSEDETIASVDQNGKITGNEYGQTTFEDLSNNLMTNESTPEFSDGDGLKILSDQILDAYGNPISDVQVNAYELGVKLSDDTIIAQDYSDLSGKWSLKLNPGTYTIEYYHPSYKTITETRTV